MSEVWSAFVSSHPYPVLVLVTLCLINTLAKIDNVINRLLCTNTPPLNELCIINFLLRITLKWSIQSSLKSSFTRNIFRATLQWRHNRRDGVSNHQPHDCLRNRLFRRRSKRTSKLRVTGLCTGNSSVNSPHKWPITRKMCPFGDVIMRIYQAYLYPTLRGIVFIDIDFKYSGLNLSKLTRLLVKGCVHHADISIVKHVNVGAGFISAIKVN